MTLVVDASVAVKWVLPEADTNKALLLRDQGRILIAPTLVIAEIGNAAWKRTQTGQISSEDGLRALAIAVKLLVMMPLEDFAARATAIAIDLRHPIYDCFYLALAEREQTPLVTADKRMFAAGQRLATVDIRML